MSLLSWLHEKLAHHQPDARFSEAMNAATEVAETARNLRKKIEPYAVMDDPFIALWTTRFETDQEHHIHEGPPRP